MKMRFSNTTEGKALAQFCMHVERKEGKYPESIE
jgi:hypothetical protein